MTQPKRIEFYTGERTDHVRVACSDECDHSRRPVAGLPADPHHLEARQVPEYRYRLTGANGEKGPGSEGYTRPRDCYLAALDWEGVAQRSDLVVPDQAHRLGLARLLHAQHPDVSEQAWADQLDPDSKDRTE